MTSMPLAENDLPDPELWDSLPDTRPWNEPSQRYYAKCPQCGADTEDIETYDSETNTEYTLLLAVPTIAVAGAKIPRVALRSRR